MKNIPVDQFNKQFNMKQITNIIMKVHFREKYLKKEDILELSAAIEEELAER